MNCIEDEPRKVPKPVPFSQNSPLHPAVPEVSLILQETVRSPSPAANNSFSGTEFQTYNAWRWKNINEKEKENLTRRCHSQNRGQEFYPINDKFSGSDIEKRKNEILYGNTDEPRRPLPPMPVPIIPSFVGASFSDVSFNNDPWATDESKDDVNFSKGMRGSSVSNNDNFTMSKKQYFKKPDSAIAGDLSDIRDLYKIISEQNRQMAFLQKQIEQLLRSESNKEKQIEQLLKSQETKESKIEQLLKMQDMKENHIEQLLKAQEKQEKQIEQLIQSQEIREQQNSELSKQLKSLSREVTTVGTMTETNVVERSTNTSFNCQCKQSSNKGSSERLTNAEEAPGECNRFGTADKSFTLNSLNLPVVQEHIPSPQSSIHVDIPDYNGSSDEETDISSSASREVNTQYLPDSKPLGYTFYNNVLTQVKDIIESNDKENSEPTKSRKSHKQKLDSEKSNPRKYTHLGENEVEKISPSVSRKNSVEKFWGMGIYEEARSDYHQGVKMFGSSKGGMDTSFEGKFDYNVPKDTQSPSDISLKMNALALKYLKEEQLSEYQIESQLHNNGRQPDVTIYNVTNLSFGTMRYLERYRMTSGEPIRQNEVFHSPHHFLQHKAKAAFRSGVTKNVENM